MVRGFSAQLNQLPGTHLRFYSDDGTLHVLGATRAEVATRARHALTRLAQLLETRKLKLERSKCECLWLNLPERPHRRPQDDRLPGSYPPRRAEVDADWGADGLLDLGGATTVRSLRVLGVLIDPGFAFTDHLEYVVSKCQRRVQVLRRLASSSWGLSTAILAHTACALLHHVACFGIVAIGPYVDQRAARRYDVRIGHVAARLVLGVSRTVRREALYTLSGLSSYLNLYQQRAATFLDSVLRGPSTSFRSSLLTRHAWLRPTHVLGSPADTHPVSWNEPVSHPLASGCARAAVVAALGNLADNHYASAACRGAIWCGASVAPAVSRAHVWTTTPATTARPLAHTMAPELSDNQIRRLPAAWTAVGAQLLRGIGWSPNRITPLRPFRSSVHSRPVVFHLDGILPPQLGDVATILATDGAHLPGTPYGAYAALILGRGVPSSGQDSALPSELACVAVNGALSAWHMEIAAAARGFRQALLAASRDSADPLALGPRSLLWVFDCLGIGQLLANRHLGHERSCASEHELLDLFARCCAVYDTVVVHWTPSHIGNPVNDVADAAAGALLKYAPAAGCTPPLLSSVNVKGAIKVLLAAEEHRLLVTLDHQHDSVSGDVLAALQLSRSSARALFLRLCQDPSDVSAEADGAGALAPLEARCPREVQTFAAKLLSGSRFKHAGPFGLEPVACYCGEQDTPRHFFGKFCADVTQLRTTTALADLVRCAHVVERAAWVEHYDDLFGDGLAAV
ncbi:unnamed protein product [Amoebophrya sp. A25]|nr:unnamed protein product [Amoebophrya sp. A25]|eukprot:GSA25T00012389001.1